MGRQAHRNEFITDSTRRRKQYKQRMFTMIRKRYELEVMCGAQIEIKFIREESSTPNPHPSLEPNEEYDNDWEESQQGGAMHGPLWYENTRPKSTKDYYKDTQKKLKLGVQPQIRNTKSVSKKTYSEAITYPARPLSPVPAAAMWFSPPRQQNDMDQLTNDDAFSQLFAPSTTPKKSDDAFSQLFPPSTTPKKCDDDFFGDKYKDMFASRAMFGSSNNHMFSHLFKPRSPSSSTTQASRPEYSSLLATSPRPEYVRQQLLGYSATSDNDNHTSMRISPTNVSSPNAVLGDNQISLRVLNPNPVLCDNQISLRISPTKLTNPSPALGPRSDFFVGISPRRGCGLKSPWGAGQVTDPNTSNLFFGTSPLHDPSGDPPTRGPPLRGPGGVVGEGGPQAPQVTDPNASNMFFGTSPLHAPPQADPNASNMFFGTSPLHAHPHKGAPCGPCGPQAPQVTDPNASNMFFGTSRRLMAEDNDDC